MKLRLIKGRALLALLLCLISACPSAVAAASEPVNTKKILTGMGTITPVNGTSYLMIQDTKTKYWGIYNTSGKQLVSYQFATLQYLSYGCFQAGKNFPVTVKKGKKAPEPTLDEVNSYALVGVDGTRISDYIYGAFKVYNHYWAAGWVLEKAKESDFDVRMDATHFYKISRIDLYYLGDCAKPKSSGTNAQPKKCASFKRGKLVNAAAHVRYIAIQDDKENVTFYNASYKAVLPQNTRIGDGVFGVKNYMMVNKVSGKMLADGFTSVREMNSVDGTYLVGVRTDFDGTQRSAVFSTAGKQLTPFRKEAFNTVTSKYVVLNQNGKVGLFSIADKKVIVPCVYDKLITNSLAKDIYVSHGYACAEKDGKRYYIDTTTGKAVREFVFDAVNTKTVGAMNYYSSGKNRWMILNPKGAGTKLKANSILNIRGSGYLVAYQNGRYYGVINWSGKQVLKEMYRNPIQITDDDRIILNTKTGYELLQVVK